jgi:hypothetical protein
VQLWSWLTIPIRLTFYAPFLSNGLDPENGAAVIGDDQFFAALLDFSKDPEHMRLQLAF